MKKIIAFLFCLFVVFQLQAQVMSAKPQWVEIKSANLRCWECKEKLEKYLVIQNKGYLENALVEWKFDLKNGIFKVKYLADRASVEDIRAALNNAGFDADDEKAEENAYKKLPPACKREADGGGPKKGAPCHLQPY